MVKAAFARFVVADVLCADESGAAARLLIGDDTLSLDAAPDRADAAEEGAPPRVELRAAEGEQFSLIVDGERVAVFSSAQPLVLETLAPGDHAIEIRSADQTVVWLRGTLELRPADALVISVTEGRMAEVFGRAGAFRPGG